MLQKTLKKKILEEEVDNDVTLTYDSGESNLELTIGWFPTMDYIWIGRSIWLTMVDKFNEEINDAPGGINYWKALKEFYN